MTSEHNPLLSKIVFPGETFPLPSKGRFYKDELDQDVENGEVHVLPMTTIDELCLKSPDLLFSGKAIYDVIGRCVPQVKQPKRLFAKDVDYLLICLRKVAWGNEIEIKHNHRCSDNSKEHSYVVNIMDLISGTTQLDPTQDFTVKMKTGQTVTLMPIRFEDYVALAQKSSIERSTELSSEDDAGLEQEINKIRDDILRVTANIIDNVDDITDKEMIFEWLNALPSPEVKRISKNIDKTTNWGPQYKAKITCKDCGKVVNTEIPLNPLSFFT